MQDEVDAAELWFCTMAPGITCDDPEEEEEEEEEADDDEETASAAPKCAVASLSRTEIESYFGLTQCQAAVQIGCHVRTLQHRCSVLQIPWPRHAGRKLTDDDAAIIFRRKFQGRTPKTANMIRVDSCVFFRADGAQLLRGGREGSARTRSPCADGANF
jgi:hypothetical protein